MQDFVILMPIFAVLLNLQGVKSHGVQPLSMIAIHRAVIDIDDQAYIRANPLILGVNVRLDYMTTILLCLNLTEHTYKKILFC